MKDIFCINAYPNSLTSKKWLMDTLDSIQHHRDLYDILLVTHYPITDVEIYKRINYIIYDDYNEMTDLVYYWEVNDKFKIINPGGHSLAIIRNMSNFIHFVKNLEYDFFYYSEGDNVFDKDDLEKILSLKNDIINGNKKMCFGTMLPYQDLNTSSYPTMFFMGYVDFFYDKFKDLPRNTYSFNNSGLNGIVEILFYQKLINNDNDILIYPFYETFKNLNLSMSSGGGLMCEILYSNEHDDKVFLYIKSYKRDICLLKVYVNDVLYNEMNIIPFTYFINGFDKQQTNNIKVDIYYDENNIDYTKEYYINNEFIEKIENRKTIEFF